MKKILIFLLIASTFACQNSEQEKKELRAEAEQYHNEGLKKLQAGNLDEALSLFDQAIAKDNTFADPHTHKVEIYLNEANYAEAIEEIDIILEKAPEVAENWVLAGIFEEKKENREKAFELYETSVEKFQDRIDQKKASQVSEQEEINTFDDEVGIVFSYILLEDFDRVDDAVAKFEEKNPDSSQLVDSFLEFNKELYMDNLFPDFDL